MRRDAKSGPGASEKVPRARNTAKQVVFRAPKMVQKHYENRHSGFCSFRGPSIQMYQHLLFAEGYRMCAVALGTSGHVFWFIFR